MAVTRDDVQDATGQRSNIVGRGFTRGFGIGPQYQVTANTVGGIVGNPINGEVGWAPGAIFQNCISTIIGNLLWVNVGTVSSALWSNIESPNVLPQFKYTTGTDTTTFAAGRLTGAQLTVYNSTAVTPGSIATRTATQMYADIGTKAFVGQSWVSRIINSSNAANTMTITAGTGVTLSGTTTYTLAEFAYFDFLMTFTSATALTMVVIAGGAAATN